MKFGIKYAYLARGGVMGVNVEHTASSGVSGQTKEPIWLTALSDVWFFPALFFTVFGGSLPIIALIHTLGIKHRFSSPIQEIIDAYHEGMAKFASLIEPVFQPLLHWISSLIGLTFHFYPHWRHLFVLALIYPIAKYRHSARYGITTELSLVVEFLFILLGTLLIGLLDPSGAWWSQGLIASIPIAVLLFGLGLGGFFDAKYDNWSRNFRMSWSLRFDLSRVAQWCSVTFVAAAGLSFVPTITSSSGLAVLGLTIIWLGLVYVRSGLLPGDALLGRYIRGLRIGLTILGGFIGAGVVFLADWVLKTYLHVG